MCLQLIKDCYAVWLTCLFHFIQINNMIIYLSANLQLHAESFYYLVPKYQ